MFGSHYVHAAPDEILVLIFKFAVGLSRQDPVHSPQARAAINISHVSKRWRSISLGVPLLWARIDAMDSYMREILLRRSGNIPLHVDFHGERQYSGASTPRIRPRTSAKRSLPKERFRLAFRAMQPHVERLEWLTIDATPQSTFVPNLQSPLPNLEILDIRGDNRDILGRLLHKSIRADTPRLREFRISGTFLVLQQASYEGLRKLHLEGIHFQPHLDGNSLESLFLVLGYCVRLVYLSVAQVYFDPEYFARGNYTFGHPRQAPLRYLQRLRLVHLSNKLSHYLLAFIQPPASLLLELFPRLDTHSFEAIQTCSQCTESEAVASRLPNIARICSLVIREEADEFRISGLCADGTKALELECGGHTTDKAVDLGILRSFAPHLEVESLTFDSPHVRAIEGEGYSEILALFPRISKLTLISCPPSPVEMLTVSHLHMFCPALRVLSLVNVHINEATVAMVYSRTKGIVFDITRLERLQLSDCYGEVYGRKSELGTLVEIS